MGIWPLPCYIAYYDVSHKALAVLVFFFNWCCFYSNTDIHSYTCWANCRMFSRTLLRYYHRPGFISAAVLKQLGKKQRREEGLAHSSRWQSVFSRGSQGRNSGQLAISTARSPERMSACIQPQCVGLLTLTQSQRSPIDTPPSQPDLGSHSLSLLSQASPDCVNGTVWVRLVSIGSNVLIFDPGWWPWWRKCVMGRVTWGFKR